MKGGKIWANGKERGDMRWSREGNALCIQWKDNKVVTMVSTIDRADNLYKSKGKAKLMANFLKSTSVNQRAFKDIMRT